MNKQQMPVEVFPPGEYLIDELEARSWSQTDFAKIIGRPVKTINEIVKNKRGITPDTARDFAAAFGTSAEFWLNLQKAYEIFKTGNSEREERDRDISRKAGLYEKFPVADLVNNNWVQNSESFDVLESRVLKFYGVQQTSDPLPLSYAAKSSDSLQEASNIQLAWLYKCASLAKSVATPKYSEKKLKDSLETLETFMLSVEEIRKIPEVLSECGVRFVIVEPWKGSKICGVCFWLDDESPVIGMTLLHDRIDNFWFVLRHEIEHVLRGDGKNGAVIDEKGDNVNEFNSNATDAAEKAANNAASDFCVPSAEMTKFIARLNPVFEEKNVIGFAKRINRHPGLVVGQLQHATGRWNIFRKHLSKVRDAITKTALTHGYGVNLTN